ncbi:hypothetical protein P3T76_012694 [Phytophthora citrophthora]|uniref:DUF659 domain-containing protein n=1 Tax=Phytophthora citrophthora TaxID=4793 RepID=A0AAD9LDL5_9STRA|nr:hypothetical protein P3T76_012694 [Phytophthora citrophthora]
MAFNKVNHGTFVKALAILNPGVVLPTARELAISLLDSSYGALKLVMVHRVKGKKCTLATDAWTDVNGKSVINYVLICGEDTYLLETVYTGSTSHSAAFLAADIKRVITAALFTTIVTDNTTANQLVWQTLQPECPQIFFHGCISHVIHLVVKDLVSMLPWLKVLKENCRKLVRFFKKHQQLWAELRHLQLLEGKNTLVLPADTRWGTIEKCLASVLDSEDIIHAFVSSRDFLKEKTKEQKAKRRMAFDIVRAKNCIPQLRRAISILDVLSRFQKLFERNTRPVSDVYKMFLDLPDTFREISMPIAELGIIASVLRERFDFVCGDAHGVAYLLDPRYTGKDMDQATREGVEDFIAKWNGTGNEDAG